MEGKKKVPKIYFNSPVVMTFTIVALVALILDQITGGIVNNLCFSVYRSRISFFFFVRLFGHCLGHAGWSHFANNITYFLLLGPALEEKYGSGKFAFMIVITAIISGLLNIIFLPNVALLGASGIVFMLIVLTATQAMKDERLPITMILVIVIYLGAEIINGIFVKDDVSQFTHIIGGICGAVFGILNAKTPKKA